MGGSANNSGGSNQNSNLSVNQAERNQNQTQQNPLQSAIVGEIMSSCKSLASNNQQTNIIAQQINTQKIIKNDPSLYKQYTELKAYIEKSELAQKNDGSQKHNLDLNQQFDDKQFIDILLKMTKSEIAHNQNPETKVMDILNQFQQNF